MRSIQSVSAGLLLGLLSSPAAAQGFEGRIVADIFNKGKPSGEFVSLFKGGKTRIEMGRGGEAFLLLDPAAQAAYTVMDQQKMYMKMTFSDVEKMGDGGKDEGKLPKIEKTGQTETIAGHTCQHYVVTDDDGSTSDICAATGLGYFGGMAGGGMPGGKGPGAGAVPLKYRHLVNEFKDGFQPLKVEQIRGGKRELVMQVKEVEKKSLDAALFEVPKGYKEFSMGGIGKLPKIPKP